MHATLSSLFVCSDGREKGVNEGSVGLSLSASLMRKSRLATVGFVYMGEDGKMPPRSLLEAGVPAVPNVLTGFLCHGGPVARQRDLHLQFMAGIRGSTGLQYFLSPKVAQATVLQFVITAL